MTGRGWVRWVQLAAGAALLLFLAPVLPGFYWSETASNPVRRGVLRARELGCFTCHGDLGGTGIPDPAGHERRVPRWTGGDWTMFVLDRQEVRRYILEGAVPLEKGAIPMPAYAGALDGTDIDDLVSAFLVLSDMVVPPADSPARRGLEVARQWNCFACHGPGASGGIPNPGSFTGFVPGWYGPDFADLVRSRAEFDEWVRTGTLLRLEQNPLARWFIRRQRTPMPAYPDLPEDDLEVLWQYSLWLRDTGGGIETGS